MNGEQAGRLQILRTTVERTARPGGEGARAAKVSIVESNGYAPGDAAGTSIAITLAAKTNVTGAWAAWA
jgi:hypothetical protein